MEVVGVIAGVPGLIQIIQAVTTAVRGVSKKDVAPKVAQNLIQSLQNVEQILERGKEQRLWDERQFEQHKATIQLWTNELASLNDVLQPSNLKKEPHRSLKKFCLVLTELEKRLNEWSTRLSQIQTELILIMTNVQQRIMRDTLKETVTARLRADLNPCSASFIPDKTPGTCDWIWSHTTFSGWTRGPSNSSESNLHRVLCIYGIKGCGKSVLVHSVAQQLRERGQIALHFSFWSSNENQRKLEHLLRTVVWQAASHITDAAHEKLYKILTRSDGIDKRSLVEAFHIALSSISQKVYCTIDGIDESTEDWNSDTDGCLSTILDLVKNHTNFHVLLTGREASMRKLLKRAVPRLEITEHLIRSDIEKLISVEIHDSLRNYSPVIKAEAQKHLEARTQIMFLWVTLVLKELRRCSSIEDVRHTLQHVPHDLDREYHRLFTQLMTRTRGSREKPSISMKRARYVLSSIIACPEPMTDEDLCYAYATQVNTSGTIEDDLITIDGIMDACGDFVRITEGRYHIIHASASDFLMRPMDEWELDNCDISYFRIDFAEVQESMSLACFKYVKSIDIGYPLTDGKASFLPTRCKFFSYVAKYFLFHLTLALQDSEKARLEMKEFVRTHHFCAFIGYIVATSQNSLQNDVLDSFYFWAQTFDAGVEQAELGLAFQLELNRREREFGSQDQRYQSWLAMSFLVPHTSHETQAAPLTRLEGNRTTGIKARGHAISSLPQHIGQAHGPVIQRLFRSLQSVPQIFATLRGTVSDLQLSSTESLPAPILLLLASAARQQEKWPLAERIAAIAVRKAAGKGDIFELCSLLSLTGVRYYINNDTSRSTEEMVREAVRIANHLPTQLHVLLLKVESLQILVLILLGQNRTGDAHEFIRMYDDLIGINRKKCDSRAWEYGLCHTRLGASYRTEALDAFAQRLFFAHKFKLSANYAAQAISMILGSRAKPMYQHLSPFVTYRNALYNARELDECISSCEKLLRFSSKLAIAPVVICIRWQTQLLVMRCRAEQGNVTEAGKWLCKAANEINLLLPDQQHQRDQLWFLFIVEDLALMGRYELAQSMAREVLEIKEISYSDDEEDLDFGPLEPLVSKLKSIGSIDVNYKGFLRCYSLLMAAEGIKDTAERTKRWERRSARIYDGIESFSKRIPLIKLKQIETGLRQDGGLWNTVTGYCHLGRFFFEQGDTEAADLVSSDAASRIFSDSSSHDPSWTFRSASDVYLYAGNFSKCIPLLCKGYEKSLHVNGDTVFTFEMEMVYAFTHIYALEEFEEDLEKVDLRLSFLERSCEHLSKASRNMDYIDRHKGSRSQEEQSNVECDAAESRRERMTDLKARLEDLNGGSMLTEVMARLESVAPGAEVSSDGNS